MKVKIKRLLLLILLITVLGMPLMLSACAQKPNLETDYFICWQGRDGTKERNEYIVIRGLTELGKQQKNLVIPKTINGIKVSAIEDNTYYLGSQSADFKSNVLAKIYFAAKCIVTIELEKVSPKIKIIDIGDARISSHTEEIDYYYFSDDIYPEYWQREDKETTTPSPANVSYFYNYENELQPEFYWLDDIEDGEKIEYIPENPVREGYAFGGWYKEPQCINKWDFEGDKVVKIKLSEVKEREDFIETRLYAKWTKN